MENWYARLLARPVKTPSFGPFSSRTNRTHPKIIALGGDHSISLPILRALSPIYDPVSAIHIDAHIDTWTPEAFAGAHVIGSKQARFADGTPYYWAGVEGLLTDTCVHAGIRSTLDSAKDMKVDEESGFTTIPASDILKEEGVHGVIEKIREIVPRDKPVYVSLDIDSLDPAFAPGTAGPAAGGWTTREVIQIVVEALVGLDIVGVDVVEVLPAMDEAEITAIAAAELTFELITTMVKNGM
jgi:agmatinase